MSCSAVLCLGEWWNALNWECPSNMCWWIQLLHSPATINLNSNTTQRQLSQHTRISTLACLQHLWAGDVKVLSHRMCSSVTVKALQSGWDVFSQTDGFFSAATDVCPVIGAELMCRALAIANSRVSSLESGPTPVVREARGQRSGLKCAMQVHAGDLLCSPLGRSMVLRTSSVTSVDRRPFNLLSQKSCRCERAVLMTRPHIERWNLPVSLLIIATLH